MLSYRSITLMIFAIGVLFLSLAVPVKGSGVYAYNYARSMGASPLNITGFTFFDPNTTIPLVYDYINISGHGVLHLGDKYNESIIVEQNGGSSAANINISGMGKLIITNDSNLTTVGNVDISVSGNGSVELAGFSSGLFSKNTNLTISGGGSLIISSSKITMNPAHFHFAGSSIIMNKGSIGNVKGQINELSISSANLISVSNENMSNIKILYTNNLYLENGIFQHIYVNNASVIKIDGSTANITNISSLTVSKASCIKITNSTGYNLKLSGGNIVLGSNVFDSVTIRDILINSANNLNLTNINIYNMTVGVASFGYFNDVSIKGNSSQFISLTNINRLYAISTIFNGNLYFYNQNVTMINDTAYSLNITGNSVMNLYNWKPSVYNTNLNEQQLVNITVKESSSLTVWRWFSVNVRTKNGIPLPQIKFSIQRDTPNSVPSYHTTDSYGVSSMFLETDIWNKNSSGDTFIGYYKIDVNESGYITYSTVILLNNSFTENIVLYSTAPSSYSMTLYIISGILAIIIIITFIYIFYVKLDLLKKSRWKKVLHKKKKISEWKSEEGVDSTKKGEK